MADFTTPLLEPEAAEFAVANDTLFGTPSWRIPGRYAQIMTAGLGLSQRLRLR